MFDLCYRYKIAMFFLCAILYIKQWLPNDHVHIIKSDILVIEQVGGELVHDASS